MIRWLRFRRSLFARQLILYLLIILLISGVISILFTATAKRRLEDEIPQQLQYIARIAADNAPIERLELIRVGDDESRMVLRLVEELSGIQEATGARNIRIFRPNGESLLDLDRNVPIGRRYPLDELTPRILQKLHSGKSVNSAGHADAGQEFITAFEPVLDAEGALFAIVGVDAGGHELAIIGELQNQLYWITGACIGVALLVALLFARSITSPVRQMAQVAEQLGAGNYAARALVSSTDEVAVLAEAINTMADQVRKRDAALKEMAASVAHEIRNPLNSIKLLVSLLDDDLSPNKNSTQQSTIETLNYEIGKLNRFIEEFLTYARPTARTRDDVAIADVVASVVEMASAVAVEKQVEIETDVGAETARQLMLKVDRLRIEQSLLNLVINAAQASDVGAIVTLRAGHSPEGGTHFAIEDSGPGIPHDQLEQIFDPFFTTKADGTGLGLANARKIIEEHEGSITAEVRRERGMRFTVHLPADRRSRPST